MSDLHWLKGKYNDILFVVNVIRARGYRWDLGILIELEILATVVGFLHKKSEQVDVGGTLRKYKS